jgi:hypothetical protein
MKTGTRWTIRLQPADGDKAVTLQFAESPLKVIVTAVNRIGMESEAGTVEE